jgi:hypothetical protein
VELGVEGRKVTLQKRSRIHQENVFFVSRTVFLFDTCSRSELRAITERRKEYYMGEGGGFPQVRAMVSQVSPRLSMACPNTKSE